MAGLRAAGWRPFLVRFERATVEKSPRGHEIEGPWALIVQAWVDVLAGKGSERRETAQLGASATATFVAVWTPTLASVTEKDRIIHAGAAYNIVSIALSGRNRGIEFTATIRKG